MDLNIMAIDDDFYKNGTLNSVLNRAFDFGFDCVAINTVVESSCLSGKNIVIPEPKPIEFTPKSLRNFQVMRRITAIVADPLHSNNFLKSSTTKKYDIICLQPIGEKMLQHVCNSLDVDLISLPLTENLGFSLKRPQIGQAISKGMCFEIIYAPCLRDQTSRKMVISNGQLLADVTKGKNLIISSGAMKPIELRSVEDVANLSLLFGLSRNTGVECVKSTAEQVLSHASVRNKTGCGFVSISGSFRLPKHQGWIVNACVVPRHSQIKMQSQTEKSPKHNSVFDISQQDLRKKSLFTSKKSKRKRHSNKETKFDDNASKQHQQEKGSVKWQSDKEYPSNKKLCTGLNLDK